VADSNPIVEFRNVSFRVGADAPKILNNLNLKIYEGEIVVLLGKSGCGKTTTLKMVNRLIEPTEGEVFVEGKPTVAWDRIKLRRHIGYVIQEAGLFPHFTVQRNVALVPSLEKWPDDKISERVATLLAMVGLDVASFGHRYPRELSGGQRQRVGVARALAADPPLLLMDEPFGALDPLTRAGLQTEFGELAGRLNKTVVLVTHDVREALMLGSRIGLMDGGKLVLLATPDEFMASENPLARAYLDTLEVKKAEARG